MMDDKLFLNLRNWFKQYQGTITAFSGGIDSALVLFLSRKFLAKDCAIGVISASESLKNKDYDIALNFAEKYDIHLKTIHTQELTDKNYNSNPANRCYFCKSHLYQALNKVKVNYPNYTIINGTNKDDFGDYRPGILAAEENLVKSPLAELGLGKEDIRELARYFGIPIWNKPASPCLSSRIPYGDSINSNKLFQIEQAEDILNEFGYMDVRVRHFGSICKIEVPVNQIKSIKKQMHEISPSIKQLGFKQCVVDEEGFVSGKLNNVLNLNHV